MLHFANQPPQAVEDVTLIPDAGNLIRSAEFDIDSVSREAELDSYGKAISVTLVDGLKGRDPSVGTNSDFVVHVEQQIRELDLGSPETASQVVRAMRHWFIRHVPISQEQTS
jgi:hypothetical protein